MSIWRGTVCDDDTRSGLMPQMTDPSGALVSFQQALLDGEIQLQHGAIDPELFVYVDRPSGLPRFTYVRLKHQMVAAMVMLVSVEPLDGYPCFQIGYAVPERYRRQGRAKSAVAAAIAELRQGLKRNHVLTFYVEAIVGTDNEASKRVAAVTISAVPTEITDSVSGLPALRYVRKIDAGAAG
jgi:hypothetical protein